MKTLLSSLALSLFIFSGCANNSLQVNPSGIHASSCDIAIDLKEISRSFHSGPLHISRYVYSDANGAILIKERGVLNDSLMFIVGPVSLMYAGFEFKKYSTNSLDDYHDLIEGTARDGEQIYLLVQSLDEGFSLIYSAYPHLIFPLANCLGKVDLVTPGFSGDNSSKLKNIIKSDWSVLMFMNHHVAVNKGLDEY